MMIVCSSLRSRMARVNPEPSLPLTVSLRAFSFVRVFSRFLVLNFIAPIFRVYSCRGGSDFDCFGKRHTFEVSQGMFDGPLHVTRGKQMDGAKESQVDQGLVILEPIFHSHD